VERRGFGQMLLELVTAAPNGRIYPGTPRLYHTMALALTAAPEDRVPEWSTVRAALARCPESPPLQNVYGFDAERERLREALHSAAQGRRVTVVLCGTSGSGRTTLLRDTLRRARCAGIPLTQGGSPAETSSRFTGIHLIRSELPMPGIPGAIHILPEPLGVDAVEEWCRDAGIHPASAEEAWGKTQGHPGSVATWIAGEKYRRPDVSRLACRIADRVATRGAVLVDDLCALEGQHPRLLLDALEPLFAGGFLSPSADGRFIVPSARIHLLSL
jgi:hypothetical protein